MRRSPLPGSPASVVSTLASTLAAFSAFSIFSIFLLVGALGCGEPPEPTQHVSFGKGLLNMELSDKWVLARSSDKQALYKHPELGNVRLTIENQTRDYGTPMTVAAVKSAVGTELNMAYGGVVTRISLSGNALIHYARDLEEGGKNLHTQNWVVARPHGYGGIARVAITLKVPDQAKADPAVASLIQSLDKQVGDAKLPEA